VSWSDAVWVAEPVDVAALLPVPSRWRRNNHEDFTWQFDGERWLINVCDWEPVDDLAEVPDRVRHLLPGVGYLISIGLEPITHHGLGGPSSTGSLPPWQPAATAWASTSSPASPSASQPASSTVNRCGSRLSGRFRLQRSPRTQVEWQAQICPRRARCS
jgi:hypothetical protein